MTSSNYLYRIFNKKEIRQAGVEDRVSFLLYGKMYTIEIKNIESN